MKYKYLFLGLSLSSLIFGADEYKGPDTVDVLIEGTSLEIPKDIFDQIALFRELLDIQGGVGALSINNEENIFKIDAMKLQNLLELLQGASLDDLTFLDLVDILVLADYLQVEDEVFLDELTSKIKDLANIDDLDIEQIPNIESIDIKVKLLNDLAKINNVAQIHWQPQGQFYFGVFADGAGQLYNLAGGALGHKLRGVLSISWRPQGDIYFVDMDGLRGRFFDTKGEPKGPFKENIVSFTWSPQGDYYFETNQLHVGSIHKSDGTLIRDNLIGALKIAWNDAQTRYLIKFMQPAGQADDMWRLYSADGAQIKQMIAGHFAQAAYWQPHGNQFFMNIDNHDLALFDQDGNEVDTPEQTDVAKIYWRPDGKAYFLLYEDKTGSFFDLTHNYFGDEFEHVRDFYWRADSLGFFMEYTNGQGGFYDNNGSLIDTLLAHVQTVYFQPKGDKFFIKFTSQNAHLCAYADFYGLNLYQQLLVQAIINRSESLQAALANTAPSTGSMVDITPKIKRDLPEEVLKSLEAAHYLIREVGDRPDSDYHKSSDEEDERAEFNGKRQNPCTNCVIS